MDIHMYVQKSKIFQNYNSSYGRKKLINRTLQDMHAHIDTICKTNDLYFRLIYKYIPRRNNQYVPNVEEETFT